MNRQNVLKTCAINYGLSLEGTILDGCPADYLSYDNINDITTILGYRYEDGKWWHDQTCVMEIIFNNYHENIDKDRIRVLYDSPGDLIFKLNQLIQNGTCCMNSIKIDLGGYFVNPEMDDEKINKEDFEEFKCRIQHKQHFSQRNPEMPDD